MRRDYRLTWLKERSTTVPAHRTCDWGPAVFMSCRFCSRIYKQHKIMINTKCIRRVRWFSKVKAVKMCYLIPHLQDVFRVGVHWDELIGYGSLAESVFLCPL